MSNSPLVDYTKISPNSTNPRRDKIRKITIHHMAGNLSVETCGDIFASPSRKASSNYGVGTDGRVGMYVEEKNRAWTSSNAENDNQAITIEVANCEIGGKWRVSDKALEKTIELCVDICKRNGIKKLNYTGDKNGNLTRHNMFANTNCPGEYLQSKFPYIAEEVNRRLGQVTPTPKPAPSKILYRVQTGAFKVKENAIKLEKELKAKGFDTYIVKVGELYKVQVGAYSVKANADNMAEKLKKAGYQTFITTEGGSSVAEPKVIKVGSKVKVKKGAKTYTGGSIANFVYNNVYTVDQLNGDRAVLDKNGICTPVNVKDLILQ